MSSVSTATEALHDVVKSGKARYIGACTMDAWQFERIQNIAERNHWTKFITSPEEDALTLGELRRHGRRLTRSALWSGRTRPPDSISSNA